ncbi:MAG: NAD(P)-dependent oxidoreductase [Acidobacteria bacterium]|nr:NAD(P)-dependent oxidoreductase [Acidobacteriota bacterium]
MKTLITGGSGYLGTHLKNYFAADDMSRRTGSDVLGNFDVERVAEYDMVVHLAALLDKDPEAAENVFLTNVEGTINVLKHMKPDAIFVFASTKDVYGRFADNHDEVPESCQAIYAGQSALEWSKLIAERYVDYYANAKGFRSCILRLSTVYAPPTEGNEPNFVGHYADAINKGERIRLPGAGRPHRDLLHVNDLASAISAFADSVIRHGTYNLGGGKSNSLSLTELVGKMEEVSGLQAIVDIENPLPDPVPMNYVTDLSLIEFELGWKPQIGLDQGLATLFGRTLES